MTIPLGGKPAWVSEIETIEKLLTNEFGGRRFAPYWSSMKFNGNIYVICANGSNTF